MAGAAATISAANAAEIMKGLDMAVPRNAASA
jgi:hypothetical protein